MSRTSLICCELEASAIGSRRSLRSSSLRGMWFLKLLGVLAISLPLAVAGTFMLGPLWAWFEEVHGIESVGHAMYAGWCYLATYAVIASLGIGVLAWPKSKKTLSD